MLQPLPGDGAADDALGPWAERLRRLDGAAEQQGCSFQVTTATVLQLLRRVLACERHAAAAALNLAQQDRLEAMVAGMQATTEAVTGLLGPQGRRVLELAPAPTAVVEEHSWWYALNEAIHALEDSVRRLASLVAGQPKGAATRTLISIVARQLRAHEHALLDEARQWIDG